MCLNFFPHVCLPVRPFASQRLASMRSPVSLSVCLSVCLSARGGGDRDALPDAEMDSCAPPLPFPCPSCVHRDRVCVCVYLLPTSGIDRSHPRSSGIACYTPLTARSPRYRPLSPAITTLSLAIARYPPLSFCYCPLSPAIVLLSLVNHYQPIYVLVPMTIVVLLPSLTPYISVLPVPSIAHRPSPDKR
jgi:hypothetical protein